MKKAIIFLSVFFALCYNQTKAQNPGAFKYQTVVRDVTGTILSNQSVGFRFSILDGSATGPVVYQETFTGTTNQFGLCSFEIGRGTVTSGTFPGINWGNGAKFLATELDAAGGSSYSVMGTAELLAVPYALYAAAGNQGPAGPPGQNGAPGLNCWDLNGNGVGDPAEDINGDGSVNAADCKGSNGSNGSNGANGTDGAPGLHCWDLNGNGVGDPAEDINGDGSVNAADCHGADGSNGSNGTNGTNGAPGLNCWDLNGNGVGDPAEDINGDGNVNAADCKGANGSNGNNGNDGAPGLHCWDLNGNGVGDPAEDINGDGNVNAADCKGSNGSNGSNGTNGTDGAPGLNCWDLNGNGVGDPAEDINGDGSVNAADCKGANGSNGSNGANGTNGAPGLHCWDLNGNGIGDPAEDINGDGNFNASDCKGSNGNNGSQGPQGPAGDATDKEYVASDITSTGSALTNVLSFPIGANETKSFEFSLMAGQTNSGAVDGMAFQLVTPALGAGFLSASVVGSVPASTSGSEIISASGVSSGAFVKVTTANGWVRISGVIKNSGSAGTVQLMFKSLDAGESSTIFKGSYVIARTH